MGGHGHHHGHGHGHHGLLHRLPSFGGRREQEPLPRGCMAIRVGRDQERFVVPVMYLNHPLFAGLLREAEEEYGFDHQGAITIPCQVEYFRRVQDTIERQTNPHGGGGHHFHLASCFGGLKA